MKKADDLDRDGNEELIKEADNASERLACDIVGAANS